MSDSLLSTQVTRAACTLCCLVFYCCWFSWSSCYLHLNKRCWTWLESEAAARSERLSESLLNPLGKKRLTPPAPVHFVDCAQCGRAGVKWLAWGRGGCWRTHEHAFLQNKRLIICPSCDRVGSPPATPQGVPGPHAEWPCPWKTPNVSPHCQPVCL